MRIIMLSEEMRRERGKGIAACAENENNVIRKVHYYGKGIN